MNLIRKLYNTKTSIPLLIILIILMITLFNCKTSQFDNIVIKVGDIEINEYIYNRNVEKFKKNYKHYNKVQPPEDSIKKWLYKYIEDLYFVMAAKEARLDTTELYKYKRNVTIKHQISKLNGLYWENTLESKTIPSKKEIDECFKLRKRVYYIKLISCLNKEHRKKYLANDTIIRSIDQFNKVYTEIGNDNPLLAKEFVLQHPFVQLAYLKDTLTKITEGKPTGPILANSFINYILINRIEKVEIQKFSIEKEKIVNELIKLNKYFLWNELKDEIIKNANIHDIDTLQISTFARDYLSIKKSIIASTENTGNEILARFYIDSKEKIILVKDIIYLLNEKPWYMTPGSGEEILEFIKEWVFNEVIYNLSLKQKLLDDREYVNNNQDYSFRLMAALYKGLIVSKDIVITDKEVSTYFELHKNDFREASEASFTVLSFNSIESANNSLAILKNILRRKNYGLLGKKDLFPGLINYKTGLRMNKGNSQYKINHFNRIIKINLDEYYGPIENNSKFDILIKEADLAFRTLDIHDANEEIWNILINRETESLLNSELKKLESKYPVKIFLNK